MDYHQIYLQFVDLEFRLNSRSLITHPFDLQYLISQEDGKHISAAHFQLFASFDFPNLIKWHQNKRNFKKLRIPKQTSFRAFFHHLLDLNEILNSKLNAFPNFLQMATIWTLKERNHTWKRQNCKLTSLFKTNELCVMIRFISCYS